MTVIADSSPVHYAVLIGVADTLLQLYSRLVIPAAVFSELNAPGASKGVRDWIAGNGESIEVRQVRLPNDPAILLLDRGEAEAIVLALESPHPLLIIDDQDGRLEARRRGIEVTGLLGVIRDAALRGYIRFEPAIQRLKATNFRMSPDVEAIVRGQYQSHSEL